MQIVNGTIMKGKEIVGCLEIHKLNNPPVFFISGHRDITPEAFQRRYVDQIFRAAMSGASFVVAECEGADQMAIHFLWLISQYRPKMQVTMYHMFDTPRYNFAFPTKGGFTSDIERDAAMTAASDFDIAWVAPGRHKSGTAQNLDRRKMIGTPLF